MAHTTDAAANRIRVLIVDDHPAVRAGLSLLLGSDDGLQVVGECDRIAEACALAGRERPDIILLDIDLGTESGLDGLPLLLEAAPKACIIAVTALRDRETHQTALRRGARGIVTKDKGAAVLIKAVRCVHAGEIWAERSDIGQVVDSIRTAAAENVGEDTRRIALLSRREREIIVLVAEGFDNDNIGKRLNISDKTVRNHLSVIFDKLGVPDRLGLAVYAFREGLAQVPPKT